MTNRTAATRYARALLEVAVKEKADLDQIQRELSSMVDLFAQHKELAHVLLNPVVPAPRKRAAMDVITARAQQPAMPVVGYLSSRSPGEASYLLAAFLQGLGQSGYVEGQNVAIEYRWAEGQFDRLPALAADLVRRNVAVIATTGGPAPGLAAKAATATIPIVFNANDGLGVTAGIGDPAEPSGASGNGSFL